MYFTGFLNKRLIFYIFFCATKVVWTYIYAYGGECVKGTIHSRNGHEPSQLHVVELKRRLKCRGATTTGKKQDLVKRLVLS